MHRVLRYIPDIDEQNFADIATTKVSIEVHFIGWLHFIDHPHGLYCFHFAICLHYRF